jgi:predicted AlkP superfamily pyrophosphatase or phosphodiesterase
LANKVVCVFVDALRPDFIDKEMTPFLYNLADTCSKIEIETVLGYSDVIDATIFTGTYPNVHGYWMKYYYDPKNSPFNSYIFWPLRIIDYIPFPFIRSGINYVLYNSFYKLLSKKLGYNELASFNIPYYLLHNFSITLRKSMMEENAFKIPTIFDVLSTENKKFYYSHGIKSETFQILKEVDLGIIYLSDIDFWAHIVGISSARFKKALSKLDKKVESIFNNTIDNNPDTIFIVFSDHGMADVHELLNLRELLEDKDFCDRYMMVLDGTMIRFWYFDEKIKLKIRSYFSEKKYGHFLSNNEKENLKINFPHNKWGDDIFLLDQGFAIYPNFMSWAKPKAMHAYNPKYKEQRGSFILYGKKCKNLDFINLVDIMPTILDILGAKIPDTVQGRSVLEENDS